MTSEQYTLQKWINETDNLVFLSGPAFSLEAGFPDFYQMEEGFLETYKFPPEEILTLTFLKRNPFLFYRFFRERMLQPMLEAQPTAAHGMLAKLEEMGKLRAVLTVNVDGIHQEAGSRNVLELCGSMMRNWCARCEKFLDFTYIMDSPTPVAYCNVDMCGDYVRPDIVLREEPYNLELLAQATELVRQADVLIVDGSALKRFPAPNLMHAYQGHKLICMNTAPMVFDARAGLVIQGGYAELLGGLELA